MGLGLGQAAVFTGGLAQGPNLALGQIWANFFWKPRKTQLTGQSPIVAQNMFLRHRRGMGKDQPMAARCGCSIEVML